MSCIYQFMQYKTYSHLLHWLQDAMIDLMWLFSYLWIYRIKINADINITKHRNPSPEVDLFWLKVPVGRIHNGRKGGGQSSSWQWECVASSSHISWTRNQETLTRIRHRHNAWDLPPSHPLLSQRACAPKVPDSLNNATSWGVGVHLGLWRPFHIHTIANTHY